MTPTPRNDMAPDMGRLIISLPRESIVLFSWIVSEYDGLGFVKTETERACRGKSRSREKSGEDSVFGVVSLFFPSERRHDVLELTGALKSEGMGLELLYENIPSFWFPKAQTEDNPEEFDSI